jgi:glycosyltransferase involved in cell wall biosynthesis
LAISSGTRLTNIASAYGSHNALALSSVDSATFSYAPLLPPDAAITKRVTGDSLAVTGGDSTWFSPPGDTVTYSVSIVDNDQSRSAESVVRDFASTSAMQVTYDVEPEQSICLARNRSIANSSGEFIAFIDDDEFPDKQWLLKLFEAAKREDVAGVLGPVTSHFDEKPPAWVIGCKFFDRPGHPTGFVIHWAEGRTGNVLLKRNTLPPGELPFDPKFHRGGDTDFFRRMEEHKNIFIWCDEAVVYEVVPPSRWTRAFMLNRALLRGSITLKSPDFHVSSVGKSVVAATIYTVALPFALLLGQDRFMNILFRLCDHLGKILAFVGINPVRSPFVTD